MPCALYCSGNSPQLLTVVAQEQRKLHNEELYDFYRLFFLEEDEIGVIYSMYEGDEKYGKNLSLETSRENTTR
jgi:hypothetical protein